MRSTAGATAARFRYVAKASRWPLVASGALLGAATIAISHLVDVGPFASVHPGVVLGTVGIAIGAAFALDDPASATLACVPASLRSRVLLRVLLAAAVAAATAGALLVVAWERLSYAGVVGQALGLAVVGITAAAVTGRAVGWRRPGFAGAAVVAAVLLVDGMAVLPGEAVLLTGGRPSPSDAAPVWAVLAGLVLVASAWATRDPVARFRRPQGVARVAAPEPR